MDRLVNGSMDVLPRGHGLDEKDGERRFGDENDAQGNVEVETSRTRSSKVLDYLHTVENKCEEESIKLTRRSSRHKTCRGSKKYDWEQHSSDEEEGGEGKRGKRTLASNLETGSVASSASRSRYSSMSLELEDRSKTMDALKQALRQARNERNETIERSKKETKELLDSQRKEHESAVKRHLGFIDKLLADKKQLSQKVEQVSGKMKQVEEKFERQIETLTVRHANEIKQLKQSLAQQESLRRQRWQEQKTKELKEVTIKGLEPEIQRILSKHKTEVRNLEERYKERLEQYKARLEDEKQQELEEAIEVHRRKSEREFAKAVEAEETKIKHLRERHSEELQKQRSEFKADTEVLLARQAQLLKDAENRHKEEVDAMRHKHQEEIKQLETLRKGDKDVLKQKLKQEKDVWHSQAIARLTTQSKADMKKWRDKLVKERDQQLDTIITKLHEEASEKQRLLQENYEKKLQDELADSRDRIQQARDQEFQWRDKYQSIARLQKEDKELFNSAGDRIKKLLRAAEEREEKIESLNRQVACVNDKIAEREREVRAEYGDRIRELTARIGELEDDLGEERQHQLKATRQKKAEMQKALDEKEAEIEEIHQRVRQAIRRKDETVDQLRGQVDELEFRLQQADELIEKQRERFVQE